MSAILPVRHFEEGKSVAMVIKFGVIKRVDIMDFANIRRGGIKATSLDEGDSLVGAKLTEGNRDLIISTKSGMAIRFKETDVRVMGRVARGVRAITLDDGDEVVNMVSVPDEENKDATQSEAGYALFTVCQNGFGKRTSIDEYRLQSRGGKGVIDIKTEGRNGPVVATCRVTEEDNIMIITTAGKVIRTKVGNVSLIGRNTMGVNLINLDEGEAVAAVSRLADSEESAEEEQK